MSENVECHLCGQFVHNERREVLNDGRWVHKMCCLENYRFLKTQGLVGKKEEQRRLI